MKKKIIFLIIFVLVLSAIVYQYYIRNDKTDTYSSIIKPQQLPSVVPGFNFPEDSLKIYKWLNTQETTSITKHAWGIWAGLTSNSDQIYKKDTLLIYQTWLGISDIATLCATPKTSGGSDFTKSTREKLDFPHQLSHHFGTPQSPTLANPGFFVSVSYDPNASKFALENLLLNQSTINKSLVTNKIGKIKPFPAKSITIKPTYYIGKTKDGLIRIPAWNGPSENLNQVFAPSQWNSYIFADVSNSQPKGKIAIPCDSLVTTPPKQSIVNLNEFIHYSIDAEAAAYITKQQGATPINEANGTSKPVVAGDLAILVAMHVATKEISNWTWQTFFWTTNPAKPDFPSSQWEAALQPKQLKGAAAHYALSTAYAMVWPNQPITGGTNVGVTPIIGYNPYLEPGLQAPFGNKNNLDSAYQYGMQTNCMSCHAMATANASTAKNNLNNLPSSLSYTADQYVDMNDTIFKNWVQLDFAWSINNNLNPVLPPTKQK